MALLETIKKDQFEARKSKDTVKTALLTTLFSEASMKGKNAGRETTDEETIQVVQKFLKGVNETISILEKSTNSTALSVATVEKAILEAYLPKKATAEEVAKKIEAIRQSGKSDVGSIMAALKAEFGSALDGKMASQLAKG